MTICLTRPEVLRESAYINGEWVQAQSGKVFSVINPANGS